jgi:excisionase family DNA binding protein
MSGRLEIALAELAEAIRAEVRAEAAATPSAPDRLLSVAEAAAALGLGRSLLYTEIASGRLRSLRVGRRRLVSAGAIREYIAERAA